MAGHCPTVILSPCVVCFQLGGDSSLQKRDVGVEVGVPSPSPALPFSADPPEGAAAHSLGGNSSAMFPGHTDRDGCGHLTGCSWVCHICLILWNDHGATVFPVTHVPVVPTSSSAQTRCRAPARTHHYASQQTRLWGSSSAGAQRVSVKNVCRYRPVAFQSATVFKPNTLFKHSHLYLANSSPLTFRCHLHQKVYPD